jgi:hypothetical protein
MTQENEGYIFRRIGTCGCEIISPDGLVVAWAVDEVWAVLIVRGLNGDNS